MPRRAVAVPSVILLAGLLFAGCSSSFTLDRPLVPGSGDWAQEGGGPGRCGNAAIPGNHENVVDAARDEGSPVLWEYSQDGPSGRAAPLLVDNTILFSSTTGMIEMVDARSGEDVGGAPCSWFIQGTPAVSEGHLFVATAGADPVLLCFDLAGRAVRYESPYPAVHAALCGVDGGVVVVTRAGRTAFFTTADSSAAWSTELGDVVTAAPAAGDSLVVIAGQNGDLTALSLRDGAKRWRLPTGAAFLAGPAVRDSAVAAVNSAGALVLAGLHDGMPRWRRAFEQPVWHAPAWRGDTIAVALSGGDVVLLHAADGRELTRFGLGELPGAAPLFSGASILQLLRDGRLMAIDMSSGNVTERARLSLRSETPVLVTPFGVVMVDEEGEAVCFR